MRPKQALQSIVISLLFLSNCALVTAADSNSRDEYARHNRNSASSVVKIEVKANESAGTGFLFGHRVIDPARPADTGYMTVVITNKHVIADAKQASFKVWIIDKTGQPIRRTQFTLDLFNKSGDSLFVVHPQGLDIAAIAIPSASISLSATEKLSVITEAGVCQARDLYEGESVLFFGFPLNLELSNGMPLTRRGTIAGIDSLANLLYLDADAFPGSSGSPLYVDSKDLLTTSPKFIGVIAAYLPYVKRYANTQTGQIEMVQTENSGIAEVVPGWAGPRTGQERI